MKKLIVLILTVALVASMGIVSVLAAHVSRDEVCAYNETATAFKGKGLAKVGSNDVDTELGDISDQELEYIVLYGWFAYEYGIEKFGYRINDGEAVIESEKFIGGDDATIQAQAAALGYPDGESVRFDIVVPVYVGEDIVVTPVVLDDEGEIIDMEWNIIYTNTYGDATLPPTPEPTPTPEATPTPEPTDTPAPTEVPTEAPTAAPTEAPTEAPSEGGCGSVIGGGFAVLAVMSAAAMILRKKESK